MNHESIAILRSEEDAFRSSFVRDLVRRPVNSRFDDQGARASVPRNIVQFWDNCVEVPDDVRMCMESWQILRGAGFALACFDESLGDLRVAGCANLRHLQRTDRVEC